jgi:hypothetical protein
MITLYNKGRLPDYNGGQPPNPRDFPLYGQKHGRRTAYIWEDAVLHVFATNRGAQVASQQSPILRIGPAIVTKSSWKSSLKNSNKGTAACSLYKNEA